MLSAHALLETVLCSTRGCPGDAEYVSGLCGYCEGERLRRRPKLTVVQLPPSGATSPMCRKCHVRPIAGPTRGRYANLCDPCKGTLLDTVVPANPSPEPPRLTLVERAGQVEEAQKAVEEAKQSLIDAEEALAQAVEGLREALGFLP